MNLFSAPFILNNFTTFDSKTKQYKSAVINLNLILNYHFLPDIMRNNKIGKDIPCS